MKSGILALSLVCAAFFALPACAGQTTVYASPDGRHGAHIVTVRKSAEGSPEMILEIRDSSGKVTQRKDYTSEDGEHGFMLDTAAWTPDSRFFIFTTFSSGGHMAWQYPTFFFDIRDKSIHDFNDFLPPIASGAFTVKAPDSITITIWTPLTTEKPLDESIALPLTFEMNRLVKARK
jgi:hypothetical protein